MRLFAQCNLAYEFDMPVEAIAKVQVLGSPDQVVVAETLALSSGARLVSVTAVDGTRLLRGEMAGDVDLAYTATVDIAPRLAIPLDAKQHRWDELPPETLDYLLPSRFCPSDKFGRFVAREFDHRLPGGARVAAILDWLHDEVDYLHGVSDAETTAERTFVDRAGVCRDFTHLGITPLPRGEYSGPCGRGLCVAARAGGFPCGHGGLSRRPVVARRPDAARPRRWADPDRDGARRRRHRLPDDRRRGAADRDDGVGHPLD